MNIQQFETSLMGIATPILDKANGYLKQAQNKYDELQSKFNELGSLVAERTGLPVSNAVVIALTVTPLSLFIFATFTSLSTPAVILVGVAGLAAAATQKDLLSKEGKLSVVASALSANILYTAIKIITALASLDIGAALLALTIGAGVSVSMYAAYKWLSTEIAPLQIS